MTTLKNIAGPMRVPFLVLAPACVLLGIGTAVWQNDGVSFFAAVFVLIGAVAAHISVNAFNEYYDFNPGSTLKPSERLSAAAAGHCRKTRRCLELDRKSVV